MQTKKYIIKATTGSKEHEEIKKIIDNLFQALNKDLDADMEKYVKPIKTKTNWGSKLYGLGSIKK